MKSRLIMLMSLAIAALSLTLAAGHITFTTVGRPPVHAPLKTIPRSYFGVYEPGSPPSYQPIATFTAAVGRKPNLVEFYSGWAAQFNTGFADLLHRHGIIPLIQIDPTDANISAIASGVYDDYLRTYADAVADFHYSVVIGFGHEMNARWYPWGRVPAPTFVAAWRHLVQVFRQEGADNVTWLWTIQADGPGTGRIGNWWPGSNYVSWVGIDGFFSSPRETFTNLFGPTIAQVNILSGRKPVLLAETAVAPPAGASKVLGLFRGVSSTDALGLVWFDVDQHNQPGEQDWRIENSPVDESTFRLGVKGIRVLSSGAG